MSALDTLLRIPVFGRQVFQGQFFSVKYRMIISPELTQKLTALKAKYPELQVHTSEAKHSVIFGGTFSTKSNFMYEVSLLRGRR